jgi:hypothetical protein
MSTVTFDAYILFALLMVGTICSMYLAGRIAARRGRRLSAVSVPKQLNLLWPSETSPLDTPNFPFGKSGTP